MGAGAPPAARCGVPVDIAGGGFESDFCAVNLMSD